MNTYQKTARSVGALFIITMMASMLDSYLVSPILEGSLADIFPNQMHVIIGALLQLITDVGVVGIAVLFYPILKKYSETVAVAYVSFRIIECVLLMVGAISSLFLISLSQEYGNAGAPEAAYFQTIASLVIHVKYIAYQIAMIVLGLGSLLLCYLLFQTQLIPRSIALTGLIGYALLLMSGLLDLMGIIDTIHGTGMIMYLPGGLFELILLPVWLFVKGFNIPTSVSRTAVTHT